MINAVIEMADAALAASRLTEALSGKTATIGENDIRTVLVNRAALIEAIADCEHYLKDRETPRQRMDRFHAEILGLMKELERVSRNREMWKGQADRQATQLTLMREALGGILADEDASTSLTVQRDRWEGRMRAARAAIAAPSASAPPPVPKEPEPAADR